MAALTFPFRSGLSENLSIFFFMTTDALEMINGTGGLQLVTAATIILMNFQDFFM